MADSDSDLIDSIADAIDNLELFDPEIVNIKALALKAINLIREIEADNQDEEVYPYLIGRNLIDWLFTDRVKKYTNSKYLFKEHSDDEYSLFGKEIIDAYQNYFIND